MFLQIAGAAFACAALSGEVDGWADAFNNNSVGGLLGVALLPLGGFGKFLLVILALGMIGESSCILVEGGTTLTLSIFLPVHSQ